MLPRSDDIICQVGSTLSEALAWIYEPEGRPRFRYFNSEIDQKHVPIPRQLDLSYEEFKDWLLDLHRHDHGYVMCYTDLFGRLNLQVTHDPTIDDGTVTKIAEFLQSKAQ